MENIKERILENRAALRMSSVPTNTKEVFQQLAQEEFCDNYGLTLKFLVDEYLKNEDIRSILAILKLHENRLNVLENKPKKETATEVVRHMIDGSDKVVGRKKDEMPV